MHKYVNTMYVLRLLSVAYMYMISEMTAYIGKLTKELVSA